MKRVHRRWHRRIGLVLVPAIALLLTLIDRKHSTPPDNAAVPAAMTPDR